MKFTFLALNILKSIQVNFGILILPDVWNRAKRDWQVKFLLFSVSDFWNDKFYIYLMIKILEDNMQRYFYDLREVKYLKE